MRRVALSAEFEADFGQRTAGAVLERSLAESESDPDSDHHIHCLGLDFTALSHSIDQDWQRAGDRITHTFHIDWYPFRRDARLFSRLERAEIQFIGNQ